MYSHLLSNNYYEPNNDTHFWRQITEQIPAKFICILLLNVIKKQIYIKYKLFTACYIKNFLTKIDFLIIRRCWSWHQYLKRYPKYLVLPFSCFRWDLLCTIAFGYYIWAPITILKNIEYIFNDSEDSILSTCNLKQFFTIQMLRMTASLVAFCFTEYII